MNLHQSRLIWPTCDDGRDTDPERDSAGFVMLLQQIPADKALTPLEKTHSVVTWMTPPTGMWLFLQIIATSPTFNMHERYIWQICNHANRGGSCTRLHELVFWRRIYRICQHVRSKWIRGACGHKLGLFHWVDDWQHNTCCIYSTEVLGREAALGLWKIILVFLVPSSKRLAAFIYEEFRFCFMINMF